MKIITWNCKGTALQPQLDVIKRTIRSIDVLILQECKQPDTTSSSFVWSDSESEGNRGVGIFAFGKYYVEPAGKPYLRDGVFLPAIILQNGKPIYAF